MWRSFVAIHYDCIQDLPDIKVEGYEFLFTEHLHALALDVPFQAIDGHAKDEETRSKDELDQTSREGQAVAASFRVLLALLRYVLYAAWALPAERQHTSFNDHLFAYYRTISSGCHRRVDVAIVARSILISGTVLKRPKALFWSKFATRRCFVP
jgi:hypothetical protein